MSSEKPAPKGYLASLSASSEELKVLRVSRKRADTVPTHFGGSREESPASTSNKRSLSRSYATKNIKFSIGRSQRTTNIHTLFQKEGIMLADASQQKSIIKGILESDIKKLNHDYFLIEAGWFQIWKNYVGYDGEPSGSKPGEVDNASLVIGEEDSNGFWALKPSLPEQSYAIVPKAAWKKLTAWYGGGPPICRKAVVSTRGVIVELYPLRITVLKIETEQTRVFELAVESTMKEVRRVVAASWKLSLLKCRLFNGQQELTSEENLPKQLTELGIRDGGRILLRSSDVPYSLAAKVVPVGMTAPQGPLSLEQRYLPNSVKNAGGAPEKKTIPEAFRPGRIGPFVDKSGKAPSKETDLPVKVPAEEPTPTAPTPVVEQKAEEPPKEAVEATQTNAPGTPSTTGSQRILRRNVKPHPTVVSEFPLPQGWEARMDEKGRTYYVDRINKKTTWKHPNMPQETEGTNSAANAS